VVRIVPRLVSTAYDGVKRASAWKEERVLQRVQAMLHMYLGKLPTTFPYQGHTWSPHFFLKEVVKLPWQEYVFITSFQYAPFYQFTELRVPDNWRHHTNYFNRIGIFILGCPNLDSLVIPGIHNSMIFMANKACPYKSSWIL
jgi:hypothetical protein